MTDGVNGLTVNGRTGARGGQQVNENGYPPGVYEVGELDLDPQAQGVTPIDFGAGAPRSATAQPAGGQQPGYPQPTGYERPGSFPQASGYEQYQQQTGYEFPADGSFPQVSGYEQGAGYEQAADYQQGAGYPAASGYPAEQAADYQAYQTGSYPLAGSPSAGSLSAGAYRTGALPLAAGAAAGDVAGQGYRAGAPTEMFRPVGRGGSDRWSAPNDDLNLDAGHDGRPGLAPPPLRGRRSSGPGTGSWSALGTPASTPTAAPAPAPKGPRLRVDWPNCKAHGLCHELLPEAVGLDEWGYPVVSTNVLPSHVADDARRAVIACPTLALHLVD
ncbi:MAG TPA: ferredoxin [Kineosporiaceae bacterium]|nr:ferredoxin [Kineosporiaceae bacterium]